MCVHSRTHADRQTQAGASTDVERSKWRRLMMLMFVFGCRVGQSIICHLSSISLSAKEEGEEERVGELTWAMGELKMSRTSRGAGLFLFLRDSV